MTTPTVTMPCPPWCSGDCEVFTDRVDGSQWHDSEHRIPADKVNGGVAVTVQTDARGWSVFLGLNPGVAGDYELREAQDLRDLAALLTDLADRMDGQTA